MFFEQEPGAVVLREVVVAVIGESIIDQAQAIPVDKFSSEVPLEQSLIVSAVVHGDRARVVILANQDVALREPVQVLVDLMQVFRIYMDQHAFGKGQVVERIRWQRVENRAIDDLGDMQVARLLCRRLVDFIGGQLKVLVYSMQCLEVQTDIATELEKGRSVGCGCKDFSE